MKLIEALAAPRRAELAQKAAERDAMVRKMSPSQALGGIYVEPSGNTLPPVTTIDAETAVKEGVNKNVWAYSCMDRLADAGSDAIWRVEQRYGPGELDWEPKENDWRTQLLAYPNEKISSKEMFYWALGWLASDGNGLLRTVEGGSNGIIELWPASPRHVRSVPGKGWIDGYNILENGQIKRKADPREFIHARLPNLLDPTWGMGMLQASWAGVQSDISSAKWRKTMYESGGVPPGAITDTSLTTSDLVKEAKDQVRMAWRNAARDQSPMVFGFGADWIPFAFSPADMMIPDDRTATRDEIITGFGMLPAMFSTDAATYDNMFAAIGWMYDRPVYKLLSFMREALNLFLLTPEERASDSVYITFDLSHTPFFRARRAAKIKDMGEGIRSGISRNDMNVLLDMGLERVTPEGGGDTIFIESGLTKLSEAAEGIKAAPVSQTFDPKNPAQPMPDPADSADPADPNMDTPADKNAPAA